MNAGACNFADEPLALSVVVPCFNEEEVLPLMHARLVRACEDAIGTAKFEILLINDGSRDGTWNVMREISERDPRFVSVNLSRNFGHQAAVTAGLELARGERVLIIDADLQDPPELLSAMMKKMDEEAADIVYGQRSGRDGESHFKKLTASVFYRILNRLTDIDIPQDTGDFRLVGRRAVDALNSLPEHIRYIRGMFAWIGFVQVPFHYQRDARAAGTTKYPLIKMMRLAFDGITSFSIMPLRLASSLALLFLAVSFLLGSYILYVNLVYQTVPGWTSTLLIMLIFTSVQLFLLGLMGEYIGRMYLEVKQRPKYIISEVRVKAPSNSGSSENRS